MNGPWRRLADVDQAPEVVVAGERLARRGELWASRSTLHLQRPRLEQRLDHRQQSLVVPRLLDVVDRTLAHQFDRRFQRRPGGHQQDRQIRLRPLKGQEQVDTLLAGGLPLGEVHVLDHRSEGFAGDDAQRLARRGHRDVRNVVEVEQNAQCLDDGRLVVDDQNPQRLTAHERILAVRAKVTDPTVQIGTNGAGPAASPFDNGRSEDDGARARHRSITPSASPPPERLRWRGSRVSTRRERR